MSSIDDLHSEQENSTMDASDDRFSYLSEPTSPSICAKDGFFFYSLPATPGFSPSPSPPATPCLFQNAHSSSFDLFEFETSRRFDGRIGAKNNQGRRLGIPLPEMTFADELFSNGKVLPLLPPLKLPPRLQPGNGGSGGKKSTTASSPRSPITVPKSKSSKNNLFDADFDPFTAALEAVRKEVTRTLEDKSRRINCLSPTRTLGLKANKDARLGLHSPLLAHEETRPRESCRPGWANLQGLATTMKSKLGKTESESRVGPLVDLKKKKNDTREAAFLWRQKSKKARNAEFTKVTWVPRKFRFPLCLGFGRKSRD